MIEIELTATQGLWLLGILAGGFGLLCIADHYYWPVTKWWARRKRARKERQR